MRRKWTRSPFVSTTAMFIFQLRFFASASAAAKICFAFSALMAAPYGMSKGMASGVPPDGGFAGGGCCAIALAANKQRERKRRGNRYDPEHETLPIFDAVEDYRRRASKCQRCKKIF